MRINTGYRKSSASYRFIIRYLRCSLGRSYIETRWNYDGLIIRFSDLRTEKFIRMNYNKLWEFNCNDLASEREKGRKGRQKKQWDWYRGNIDLFVNIWNDEEKKGQKQNGQSSKSREKNPEREWFLWGVPLFGSADLFSARWKKGRRISRPRYLSIEKRCARRKEKNHPD